MTMTAYFIAVITAALVTALVGILSPNGEKGGIAKHMKLLVSLFLLCILISPLQDVIAELGKWTDGSVSLPDVDAPLEDHYRQEMEEAIENASDTYFTQMLTQVLEAEFSIKTGEIRCRVDWKHQDGKQLPSRVTVILSGSAIWKDPQAIEDFVRDLLGCECVSAIE